MPRVLTEEDVTEFRSRLCEAARRRYAADGETGVSLRRLASDLGVSATTPYRYFHDKDEILAALRADAFDRFAASLERAFASRSDPVERSVAVGEAYVAFAFGDPDSYRLMFDLNQPDSDRYPELARAAGRARRTMTAHTEALQAAGLIEGDPALVGRVYWATLHGLIVLELAGKLEGGPDFRRVHREAMRILWRGARSAARTQRRRGRQR